MKRDELMSKIADLEREIAVLPEGSITKKNITIIALQEIKKESKIISVMKRHRNYRLRLPKEKNCKRN
jgi:hypothetical protein